jgi:hypothetical protein
MMKRISFAKLCLFTILSIHGLVGCKPSSTNAEVQAAMKRGDSIVVALNRYKEEKGIYPVQLNRLVPEYFEVLPSAPRNEQWGYRARENETKFQLWYDWGEWDVQIFTSGGGEWVVDTK